MKRASGKKKTITLHDVVWHMQGMEQRLTKDMQGMEQRLTKRIDGVESRLTKVEHELPAMEERLIDRMNDLQRDIDATMWDTIKIQRHVGMALPDAE